MLQCVSMSIAAPPEVLVRPPRRFSNAAEWHHALGDIPLERIVFDPWPGTATEADLLRLVECEKRLCELIDGTLVEKPVGLFESRIASKLSAYLTMYVDSHDLGGVSGEASTLRMSSTGRVRLPDIAFISKARDPASWKAVPTVSPDLAVEVLSEGNTKAEMQQKLREYFASGTRLVWFVEPRDRTVAVYHGPEAPTVILRESDILDGEQVVPGFKLPVSAIFQNIPPFES
jgi:Uma2 family endonuclease